MLNTWGNYISNTLDTLVADDEVGKVHHPPVYGDKQYTVKFVSAEGRDR